MRLTAEDGYQALRSYSLGLAGTDELIELAVDEVPNGEVSPYLVHEVRSPETRSSCSDRSAATSSGMTSLRRRSSSSPAARASSRCARCSATTARSEVTCPPAFSTPHAARRPDLPAGAVGLRTTITLPRDHWAGRTGRVDRELLEEVAWPATDHSPVYVCGPTGFVEAVAAALVALGDDASRVRTERFSPT